MTVESDKIKKIIIKKLKEREKICNSGLSFELLQNMKYLYQCSTNEIVKTIIELKNADVLDFYLDVTCPWCKKHIDTKKNHSRYVKDICCHCDTEFTLSLKDVLNYIRLNK